MLIKDLKNEKFEFDRVTITKNLITEKWEIKHEDKVVFNEFITKEEAMLWAVKISKEVVDKELK